MAGIVAVPAAAIALVSGAAEAQTATPIPDAPEATTAEPTGAAPEPEPPAGETAPENESRKSRLRLRTENVTPQKIFFTGSRPATFEYEIAGGRRRDLIVEVLPKGGGKPSRRWTPDNVEPGDSRSLTWGGKTARKRPAGTGRYMFRVREQGGELADRSRADGDRSFGYFDHIFPIRGRHTYGDGIGAPRKGHSHQGVDLFANCGTPLDSARAGKVQFKGYQGGGAGFYVVIDGKRTGRDYVYMHLRGKARVAEGERVRTGERIGEVGDSGNASGCHLHFELWSKPGWYEGGHFLNPKRKLKKWDKWS
jgi:murein DD-endopeptidase MepM/ murein hydrolase activator NlpD